jgi:hypothetical protein
MNICTVSFRRCTAVACATVITAVSAWVFVSSSASVGRDPFQFAAVMAANAEVQTLQIQARNATPACWSESLSSGHPTVNPIPVCQRG